MSIYWTKRPQNFCCSCGNSWYPRGKNRSDSCPRCGSPDVQLFLEGCLGAIGHLVAAPFVLLTLLVQFVVKLCFALGWLAAKLIGVGASELAERSQPARSAARDLGTALGKHLLESLGFGLKWLASVKDDVFAKGDRDVNPVSFVAKMMVLVVTSVFSIILLINVYRCISQ